MENSLTTIKTIIAEISSEIQEIEMKIDAIKKVIFKYWLADQITEKNENEEIIDHHKVELYQLVRTRGFLIERLNTFRKYNFDRDTKETLDLDKEWKRVFDSWGMNL